MFEAQDILFIYVESPLHVGAGRGLGVIDQPLQRDRASNLPIVQASSIKGRLRAEADPDQRATKAFGGKEGKDLFYTVFGPDTSNADAHAGALSVGDARLLFFPVRSLAGVYAWVTSLEVLERFVREAERAGLKDAASLSMPADPGEKALVGGEELFVNKPGDRIALEDVAFPAEHSPELQALGETLAKLIWHGGVEGPYQYWIEQLPKRLCLVSHDDLRDFATYSTEVRTHVRLDAQTKTAAGQALWNTESFPPETVLYAPLMASASRSSLSKNADEILGTVQGFIQNEVAISRLGGNETTGQGVVALKLGAGAEKAGADNE